MKLPAFESIEEKRDAEAEWQENHVWLMSSYKDITHADSYKSGFNAAIEIRDQMWAAKVEKLITSLEKVTSLTHSWVIAEHTINCKHSYGDIRLCVKEALDEFYNNSSNDKLSRKDDE